MSSDSDASSPAVESGASGTRSAISRWKPSRAMLKYIVLVAILASWIIGPLLQFFLPVFSDRLLWIYLGGLVVLFFLFLGALLRRRWKEVVVFFAIWAIVLYPFYGVGFSLRWLLVASFRLHAAPIEEYLSRCKLIEFVENDVKQKLGVCERLPLTGDGMLAVIYDTTGELMVPVSQRTPEWTKAMVRFSPGNFFTQSEGRADRLFGNFYDVSVPIQEADGADDDYQGADSGR